MGIAPPADGAHDTWVEVTRLQAGLCGGSRPHFFRGVATVLNALAHNLSVASICRLSRTKCPELQSLQEMRAWAAFIHIREADTVHA